MQFLDQETEVRIARRRIDTSDIELCLRLGRFLYRHRNSDVFGIELPDGRNLKVSVLTDSPEIVTNAFTYH